MSGRSPIEFLQRPAPVSDVDAAAVFGVAGREELLVAVTSLGFGRPSRLRPATRRRRLVLAVAVLVLVGVATAGTWAVLGAPAQETTSVECVSGSTDAIIPSTSGDPAADCAAAWQSAFGAAAPPLAAYDNGLGGVSVIPRSEKPRAGWTPITSQDVALIELQESLDDVIDGLDASCLDGVAATRLADSRLAQFGFTGWTVTVRDSTAAATPGDCVSAEVIDPVSKTVTLIPMGAVSAAGTPKELAEKLQPVAHSCLSLSGAAAAVRAAGASLGLSPAPPESAQTYNLQQIPDDTLRCALVYENVGGATDVIVRGPSGRAGLH